MEPKPAHPDSLVGKVTAFRCVKESLVDLVSRVHDLATLARGQTQNDSVVSEFFEKYEVQAAELDRYGLRQPKLRVIVVGRVKAGKSLFINALLGQYICAVDNDPCTSRVCKLVYSPVRTLRVGDKLEKKGAQVTAEAIAEVVKLRYDQRNTSEAISKIVEVGYSENLLMDSFIRQWTDALPSAIFYVCSGVGGGLIQDDLNNFRAISSHAILRKMPVFCVVTHLDRVKENAARDAQYKNGTKTPFSPRSFKANFLKVLKQYLPQFSTQSSEFLCCIDSAEAFDRKLKSQVLREDWLEFENLVAKFLAEYVRIEATVISDQTEAFLFSMLLGNEFVRQFADVSQAVIAENSVHETLTRVVDDMQKPLLVAIDEFWRTKLARCIAAVENLPLPIPAVPSTREDSARAQLAFLDLKWSMRIDLRREVACDLMVAVDGILHHVDEQLDHLLTNELERKAYTKRPLGDGTPIFERLLVGPLPKPLKHNRLRNVNSFTEVIPALLNNGSETNEYLDELRFANKDGRAWKHQYLQLCLATVNVNALRDELVNYYKRLLNNRHKFISDRLQFFSVLKKFYVKLDKAEELLRSAIMVKVSILDLRTRAAKTPILTTAACQKEFATGGSSRVFVTEWEDKRVAVKKIALRDDDRTREVCKEVYIHHLLVHPRILPFLGCIQHGSEMWIITPYMQLGSLHDLLNERSMLAADDSRRYVIARDVGEGVCFIHWRGHLHRDIKSANILIDDEYRAKIGDFGAAEPSALSADATGCGTPMYIAPEVLATGRGGEPADIYSMGIVFYQLSFVESSNYFQKHYATSIRKRIQDISTSAHFADGLGLEFNRLLLSCVAQNPKDRPSAMQLLHNLESNHLGGKAPKMSHSLLLSPSNASNFLVSSIRRRLPTWPPQQNFRLSGSNAPVDTSIENRSTDEAHPRPTRILEPCTSMASDVSAAFLPPSPSLMRRHKRDTQSVRTHDRLAKAEHSSYRISSAPARLEATDKPALHVSSGELDRSFEEAYRGAVVTVLTVFVSVVGLCLWLWLRATRN